MTDWLLLLYHNDEGGDHAYLLIKDVEKIDLHFTEDRTVEIIMEDIEGFDLDHVEALLSKKGVKFKIFENIQKYSEFPAKQRGGC